MTLSFNFLSTYFFFMSMFCFCFFFVTCLQYCSSSKPTTTTTECVITHCWCDMINYLPVYNVSFQGKMIIIYEFFEKTKNKTRIKQQKQQKIEHLIRYQLKSLYAVSVAEEFDVWYIWSLARLPSFFFKKRRAITNLKRKVIDDAH